MSVKLTYEYVKGAFRGRGFILLSEQYENNDQLLAFKCSCGHVGKVRWCQFSNGSGCKQCSIGDRSRQRKLDSSVVHKIFNDEGYEVIGEYISNNTPLEVICSAGHKYKMRLSSFKRGHRCKYCYGNNKVSIADINKEVVKANYKLISTKYVNNREPLRIKCDKGHIYNVKWNTFQSGRRCPYCSNTKVGYGNDLLTQHPLLCAEWSNSNTTNPSLITSGSNKKVWWVCSKGHDFKASVASRTGRGHGCPYCSGQRVGYGNDLLSLNPLLCEEWDFSLNDKQPHQVTLGSRYKAWWICLTCGVSWRAPVQKRAIRGDGCRGCLVNKVSKISQEWLDSLGVEDREVRLKIKTKAFTVDGFDPKTNTIYEFLGDYWHGNPDVFDLSSVFSSTSGETLKDKYTQTFSRFAKLEEAGYNIVFIWENDYKEGNHPQQY